MAAMRVRNVHRRSIQADARLGQLLDGLGSPRDRLWPGDRWPPLRLDRPLEVGARGGHGPIRYRVELYEPGRRVRFQFERPRGFHGYHEFHIVAGSGGYPELVHVLEARMTGVARLSWPLIYRPLHDALIEDALDNAHRVVTGERSPPGGWPPYVTALRWALTRAAAVRARRAPRKDAP
jgi:hypothetical protein